MAYQALYRKWRPLSFDDVVGQRHIVTTLKNEISSGKAAHAYLFCGTRGTGKTSCAKIFARAINCLNPVDGNPCNECEICKGALNGSIMDITEIDAASNNGVDNIREIREEVAYSAAQAKYKIYIIDEVHMLSGGAFNALLKTLEEPPEHVVFILATTEAHKLPATITSRCQRFDFRRIAQRDIVTRMREICTAENIDADIEALELIARLGDGAMRDALSILDQCAGACTGHISLEDARAVLSVSSDEAIEKSVRAICEKNPAGVLGAIEEISTSGRDINNYIEMLIRRFRDILVCKVSGGAAQLFEYSDDTIKSIKKSAELFGAAQLSYIIESLCSALADAKWQKNARTLYELALMRLCDDRLGASNEAILMRLEKLEAMISGTAVVSAPSEPVYAEVEEKSIDIPPWEEDTFTRESENKKAQMTISKPDTKETVKPKAKAPDTARADAPINQVSAAAVANAWEVLLGTLKKKNPPLYGMLCMKQAKFKNNTLYLINEAYVKNILATFKQDFSAALKSLGEGIRVGFVTESEFEMMTDESRQNTIFASDNYYDDEPEMPPEEKVQIQPEGEYEDPLDALINLGNDDIIVE